MTSNKLYINKFHIFSHTRIRSFLSDVVEAVSGSEQDFTEGKLSRAILLLTIPAVLEMIMESIFVIVDILFVSKLGSNAVATVGITESMITIVYAISLGLATATTSMVSRRIGERNADAASSTAVQAIITGITVSLLIGIPGAFFAKDLLRSREHHTK
jgi:Na+-driven multidrug efflux pump